MQERIDAPELATANPLQQAGNAGAAELYRLLAEAAVQNEPRVRELIAIAQAARLASADQAARRSLWAIEFGLGALLPPVNLRVSARLAEMLSRKQLAA